MPKRILLLLSETRLATAYTRFLARKGFHPFYFPDPQPALVFYEQVLAQRSCLDLILIDFDFSPENLNSTVPRLKQLNGQASPNASLLGMTNNPALGKSDGQRLGVPAIIPKPISPPEFLSVVKHYSG